MKKLVLFHKKRMRNFFYNKMVTFPQNANVTASKLFKSNGGKKYEEKTRKPVSCSNNDLFHDRRSNNCIRRR